MDLPDYVIMLIMEKAAAVIGTMSVLRGFASARRRFQQLAHGPSSKLFEAPVFMESRLCRPSWTDPRDRDLLVFDIAQIAGKFGGRFQRLCLADLRFGEWHSGYCPFSKALGACPNLTHLSLANRDASESYLRAVASLQHLPKGFRLPRLRHLDLSGLAVPLPALRRLLGACAASVRRLFLRKTSVSGPQNGALEISTALKGLNFPRLESLDLSDTGVGVIDLRRLLDHGHLPALADLYVHGREIFKKEIRRRGLLVVYRNLDEMHAAALRELRRHFDGTAYPRPESSRLNVPRLAVPFFLKALSAGPSGVEVARRLVTELGVSPLARLSANANPSPWIPEYFRARAPDLQETALQEILCAGSFEAADLIAEWELGPLVNLASSGRRSPLHLAVEHSPSLVELLLESGADVLCQDAGGATALHLACELGQRDVARALLEAAARADLALDLVSAQDGAGRTPLQVIVGHALPLVKAPSRTAYGHEDQWAAAIEYEEWCRAMRIHEEEMQQKRHNQSLVATHAIEFLALDGLQLEVLGVRTPVLEEPVWGRGRDEPLLHFAARECTPAAVRALLSAGADPCQEGKGGATVLQIAERARDAAMREAILAFAEENGVPLERLGGSRPRTQPP
eukprot:tig00021339_g20402.t1